MPIKRDSHEIDGADDKDVVVCKPVLATGFSACDPSSER
jgi:hypothetical protein